MKSVFYCHSPITLLLATSVIRHLRLEDDNVHILWGRGYQWNKIPYASTLLPGNVMQLADVPSYGEVGLTTTYQQELSSLDNILSEATRGQQCILYLPSTRNFLMQACATHPLVNGLHFIEEGLMTYTGTYKKITSPLYQGLTGGVKRWIKRNWHGGRSNYYRASTYLEECRLYTLHPAFPAGISPCPVVSVPLSCPATTPAWPYDSQHIFVFDAMAEFGDCSSATLISVFFHFLTKSFDRSQTLIVRFHPAQKIQDKIIAQLESAGVDYRVDEGAFPLELILASRKDLILYGFHSSLLFYGALLGHRSISLSQELACQDAVARAWYQTAMPPIFFEQVEMI